MNRRRGAAPPWCGASSFRITPTRVIRECARRRASSNKWTLIIVIVAACTSAAAAQHYEHALPADFNQPIGLFKSGLGPFTRAISSTNRGAQAYFSQGFQLMYAFAKAEAGRSFREAQRQDPNCAICYWGKRGRGFPDVNGRMTAEHSARAYAAIQKAVTLSPTHADAKEQALIRAMAVRYVEHFDPSARRAAGSRVRRRDGPRRRRVSRRPGRRDALRRGAVPAAAAPGSFDVDDPAVARCCDAQGALKRDIRHPGVPPLHPHDGVDGQPGRAVAVRDYLGIRSPAPATSTTCRRTRGPGSGDGATRCRRACRRGSPIRRRPRVGIHDLPGARPPHARVRGVDGRPSAAWRSRRPGGSRDSPAIPCCCRWRWCDSASSTP